MKKAKERPDSARAAALATELRLMFGRLKRRLREQANTDEFTGSQLAVLRHLYLDGPATVTALAKVEGVRPQSMGATVAVLEAAGLVRGATDPADGRQTILSLTESSRQKIKAGQAAHQDWLFRAIRTNLTPAEQEQLAAGVELLKRVVDT